MSKSSKSRYICQNCGAEHIRWEGKCKSCGSWNTLKEQPIIKDSGWVKTGSKKTPVTRLSDIDPMETKRIALPDNELNKVLGGGIVLGGICLIAGAPGIGKSTLMLQMALQFKGNVLYISAEESGGQLKNRADRLGGSQNSLFVLVENRIPYIQQELDTQKYQLVIVDSIQTIQDPNNQSSAASISQIRECATFFQQYAKQAGVPIFLIGHVNKEGHIAGPKVLEHLVDTVLSFEGEKQNEIRFLRCQKNRFGPTDTLGIYQMGAEGLRQVVDASQLFYNQRSEPTIGVSRACVLDGIQPLIVECQVLVNDALYSTAQRSAIGIDQKRLHMLLAILEKYCGLMYAQSDVFINIAGGLKISDTSLDLSIAATLISSLESIAMPMNTIFLGELSLSGEIRPASGLEKRLLQAEASGFSRLVLAKGSQWKVDSDYKLEVLELENVSQLYDLVASYHEA